MSHYKRKAQKVRFELLAEAGCELAKPRKEVIPWPILKERLDDAFSELVRLSNADELGNVKCITCDKTGWWQDFDAGHFVTRDHLPTRWDMDNVKPQCQHENRRMGGKPYEFGRALNLISPGLADRLILKGSQPADQVRHTADQLLLDIRAQLKVQRKRFK